MKAGHNIKPYLVKLKEDSAEQAWGKLLTPRKAASRVPAKFIELLEEESAAAGADIALPREPQTPEEKRKVAQAIEAKRQELIEEHQRVMAQRVKTPEKRKADDEEEEDEEEDHEAGRKGRKHKRKREFATKPIPEAKRSKKPAKEKEKRAEKRRAEDQGQEQEQDTPAKKARTEGESGEQRFKCPICSVFASDNLNQLSVHVLSEHQQHSDVTSVFLASQCILILLYIRRSSRHGQWV